MNKKNKNNLALLLMVIWGTLLWLLWWLISPETFWQRLIVIGLEIFWFMIVGMFLSMIYYAGENDNSKKKQEELEKEDH